MASKYRKAAQQRPNRHGLARALALALAMAASTPVLAGSCDVSDPSAATCDGVFAGGNTPFLVHKAEPRNIEGEVREDCFSLVGDCYVHGIMDGETMENLKLPMYLV